MSRVRGWTAAVLAGLAALVLTVQPAVAQEGPLVFVGSSIFHRWTNLTAQMAPLPVVNRAVDGLMTSDVLAMVDRAVLPLHPRVVVYYCGSNDVDAGEPAEAIVARIRRFVDRVLEASPSTRIVFVSVNRAPEKRDRWDVVDAVNRQVEAYGRQTGRVRYVDVNPVLIDAAGEPRMDLFMPDALHLRPAAYEGFARILKPVLEQAYANR